MAGIVYGLYEQLINGIVNEHLSKIGQYSPMMHGQRAVRPETSLVRILFLPEPFMSSAWFPN